MADPVDAGQRVRRAVLRSRGKAAVLVSAALHAALLIVAGRLPWGTVAEEFPAVHAPPPVMWLREPQLVDESVQAATAPAEQDTDAVAVLSVVPPLQPPVEFLPLLPPPEPPDQLDEPPAAESLERRDAPPQRAARSDSDSSEEPPAAVPIGDIDWEEERRRVIEQLVEQREREARYHTFSLADVLDEPEAVPQEPGPERSIFEPGGGSRSARSVARPGQARTKVGRVLSDLCHALTGGFGVMGLFSACADDNTRSDLFAHLKPEYLRRRPEDFVTRRPDLDGDGTLAAEPEAEAASP